MNVCELAQLVKRGLRQYLTKYENNIIGGPGGKADIDKSMFGKSNIYIYIGV